MSALYILRGPHQGQRFPLNSSPTLIGRSSECAIILPGTSVSRRHARIVTNEGKYYLEDMQSRNGTRLNGKPIASPTPLRDRDEIQVCDFVAVFREIEPTPSPNEDTASVPMEQEDSSTVIRARLTQSTNIFLEIESAERLKVILAASNHFRKTLELDQLLPRIAETMLELFKRAEALLRHRSRDRRGNRTAEDGGGADRRWRPRLAFPPAQ